MLNRLLRFTSITVLALAQLPLPLQAPVCQSDQSATTFTSCKDTYLLEQYGEDACAVPGKTCTAAPDLLLRADVPDEHNGDLRETVVLLDFDLRAVPPGSRVTAASLTLNVEARSAHAFSAYPLTAAWEEAEATWLSPSGGRDWDEAGARGDEDRGPALFHGASASAAGMQAFSIQGAGLAAVQEWINHPERNYGLALELDEPNTAARWLFSSSEDTNPAVHPRLALTYVKPAGQGFNREPIARPVNGLSTAEDTPLAIDLPMSDADGDPLSVLITASPAHGKLVRSGAQLVYQPEANFAGLDAFLYAASDGLSQSAPAEVRLTVTPVNDAPLPGFTASALAGVPPLAVQFNASVSDPEGDPLTYRWDFGGLGEAGGSQAGFTFQQPGVYPVTLTVSDGQAEQAVTRPVVVYPPGGIEGPRNVILFVGDGMGSEQIQAAGLWARGGPGLLMEGFPFRAEVETLPANYRYTDSAAAASAMATGRKANRAVISVALPGDGSDLPTALEIAQQAGRSTGLVTTTGLTDATPGGFGAHTDNRNNRAEIGEDFLQRSRPEVLFGALDEGLSRQAVEAAGYSIALDRAGLLDLRAADPQRAALLLPGDMPYRADGPSAAGWPSLAEMTAAALDILDDDPDGLFLLVENENIDRAGHIFDLPRIVPEVLDLDSAVAAALDWARTRPNTLIVVLGDHETGGLVIDTDRGRGQTPDAHWTAGNHSPRNVSAFAVGPGAERLAGTISNTDIFNLLVSPPPSLPPPAAGSTLNPRVWVPQIRR